MHAEARSPNQHRRVPLSDDEPADMIVSVLNSTLYGDPLQTSKC